MNSSETDNQESFFNKHFGAIITAIVSFSAVVVSLTQVWVASIDKEKEIEIIQASANETRKLEEKKSMRQWQLDLAKFMAQHREDIFTPGTKQLEFQKIMLATFPKEVTLNVFGSLSEISDVNDDYWEKAENRALNLYTPRAKIYYEENFPDIFGAIPDTIGGGDIEYNYSDQVIPKGLTSGDVRYFHESDRVLAIQVQKEFSEFAYCEARITLILKIIPLINSKLRAPKGTVEIWLPEDGLGTVKVGSDC